MTADERRLREDLATLAASEHGRRLLQLGLRGIERGEQGVTAGCWTRHGSAGCLFQHAYWEAVREGIFADAGRPGDWIGNFVGPHDYGIVIRAIASFDRLARSTYSDVEPRGLLPDRVRIRQSEWNTAVARLLMETLGRPSAEPQIETSQVSASV
jgi:hypothetical protein